MAFVWHAFQYLLENMCLILESCEIKKNKLEREWEIVPWGA